MSDYEFTNDWFARDAAPVWLNLLPQIRPSRILEVGSYEGASACFAIESCAGDRPLELHCIDTWDGGVEHQSGGLVESDMGAVEARFHRNIEKAKLRATNQVNVIIHRGRSEQELAGLIATGKVGFFDFCYIDGSHQAPDVLCDAVLAFQLLRVGGTMVFDDYLWSEETGSGLDPLRCPKPAIDAFTNLYARKLRVMQEPLYQFYVTKTAS